LRKKIKICEVCNNPITSKNARKICSDPKCKKANKAKWQKANNRKVQIRTVLKGKECEHCHKVVHEHGMKKYCHECKSMLKRRHYSKYAPIKEVKLSKPKPKRVKKIEIKPPRKKQKPINPKWLVRGLISSSTRACAISSEA